MEEDLYQEFLPTNYPHEDVITYHWNQSRDNNLKGQFNFYYSISKDSISQESMLLYIILLLTIGVLGDMLSNGVMAWLNWPA